MNAGHVVVRLRSGAGGRPWRAGHTDSLIADLMPQIGQRTSDPVVAPNHGSPRPCGMLMNIVLGIVGAAIASAIFGTFGVALGGWIGYLIAGFIGACLLI